MLKDKLENTLKGVLYFAVLAPPIGALSIGAFLFAGLLSSGSSIGAAISGGISMGLMFAIGSHILGIVPAGIVGLLCGPFRASFKLWRYCLLAAFLGALVATIFAFVAVADQRIDNPYLMFSLPGFVGALLVSRIFGVRASDNSSKPMPLRDAA